MEQMKLIQALASLPPEDASGLLASQAFRQVADYSQVTAVVAGYKLWDRIAANPALAIEALRSTECRGRRSRRMGPGESRSFGSSRVAAGAAGQRCGLSSTDHSHSQLAG